MKNRPNEWLWWLGCACVAITLTLLLHTCALAGGGYWFKTGQAVVDAPVIYVDVVTCGEHANALGCFLEVWPGRAGVIVVKKGLPPFVEKCVRDHEQMHAAGWRHTSAPRPFLDCGNGNFVSSEMLIKWGVL